MKKFAIITLFPEAIRPLLSSSMMWKAQKDGIAEFFIIDLREFGLGPRRQVDDKPFGGGAGMLLMIEPMSNAIKYAQKLLPKATVVLMSPSRDEWSQRRAEEFASSQQDYIIICGHYEGFDARIENLIDTKISIGRYILTGGELPALCIIDSVVRLLPGVLGGGNEATMHESYSHESVYEYPQYTRPAIFNGQAVPEVLLSGDHAKIRAWQQDHAIKPHD